MIDRLKPWAWILAGALLCTPSARADSSTTQHDTYAYVVGASVSLGFNMLGRGYSPPLFALQQMGYPRDRIIKKTRVSGSFRSRLPWLKKQFATHPPSILMGLDLFHHDLRLKQEISPSTYAYVDEVLDLLEASGAPYILGSTWTRYDNRATIDEMNAYLTDKQAEYRNLHLFPAHEVFDALYFENQSYAYDINGIRFDLSRALGRKLLIDVVHPNRRGARVFANLLIDIANRVQDAEHPYYPVDDVVSLAARVSRREERSVH